MLFFIMLAYLTQAYGPVFTLPHHLCFKDSNLGTSFGSETIVCLDSAILGYFRCIIQHFWLLVTSFLDIPFLQPSYIFCMQDFTYFCESYHRCAIYRSVSSGMAIQAALGLILTIISRHFQVGKKCIMRPKKPAHHSVGILTGRKKTSFSHLCSYLRDPLSD